MRRRLALVALALVLASCAQDAPPRPGAGIERARDVAEQLDERSRDLEERSGG